MDGRMLRSAVIAAVLALSAVAPLAVIADENPARSGAEASAQKERVGCWSYERYQVGFKKKPGKCVFMKNGGTSYAYSVYVTDMKNWKHWGRPTTKVEGVNRANMGATSPVKVRLSRIKNRCGQRVYTKAKFTFPRYGSSSSFRLYSCKR